MQAGKRGGQAVASGRIRESNPYTRASQPSEMGWARRSCSRLTSATLIMSATAASHYMGVSCSPKKIKAVTMETSSLLRPSSAACRPPMRLTLTNKQAREHGDDGEADRAKEGGRGGVGEGGANGQGRAQPLD